MQSNLTFLVQVLLLSEMTDFVATILDVFVISLIIYYLSEILFLSISGFFSQTAEKTKNF